MGVGQGGILDEMTLSNSIMGRPSLDHAQMSAHAAGPGAKVATDLSDANPPDTAKGSNQLKTRKRTKTGCLSMFLVVNLSGFSMADRPQLVASDGSSAGKSARPATTASSPNGTVKGTRRESSSKIR